MRLIGLCGRSGCGKSYFSSLAVKEGILVIDCDAVYKNLVSYRSECLKELEQAFGSEIIENNALNRRALAPIVFSNPEKLKLLNDITHKHVENEMDNILKTENPHIAIIDAPMLFESGIDKRCDIIIGIVANDDVCVKRIMERDNISQSQAVARLSNQKSIEFFYENCHIIIENQSTLEDYEKASLEVIKNLRRE